MSNSANSFCGDAMVQLYACGPAYDSSGQSMLSAIHGYLGCYLFASTDTTGPGSDGDWELEWPGQFGQFPGSYVPYSWLVYTEYAVTHDLV